MEIFLIESFFLLHFGKIYVIEFLFGKNFYLVIENFSKLKIFFAWSFATFATFNFCYSMGLLNYLLAFGICKIKVRLFQK